MILTLALAAHASTFPSIDDPLRTGARADGDAAVVIGVQDYFRLPEVPHARRDAGAVYDFLVYTRGLPADHVQLLDRDATREAILSAVDRAVEDADPSGTVWVYYAGHGAASPTDGARLWLGVDALPSVDSFAARGVRVDDLREAITRGGASAVILSDACYTGADRSGAPLVPGARFAVPTRAAGPTPRVTEWSAVSASEVALPLDPVQHGAFTYLMLGALRGWADGERDGQRDGQVTAEEAALYVRASLRALQRDGQTPSLSTEDGAAVVLSRGVDEVGPTWTAAGGAPAAVTSPPPVVRPPAPAPGGQVTDPDRLLKEHRALDALEPEHHLARGFGREMEKKVGPCRGFEKFKDDQLKKYTHGQPGDGEWVRWGCYDGAQNLSNMKLDHMQVWRGDDAAWAAFRDAHVAQGATVESWSFEPSFTLMTSPPQSAYGPERKWLRAGFTVYAFYWCDKTDCAEVLRDFVKLTHDDGASR